MALAGVGDMVVLAGFELLGLDFEVPAASGFDSLLQNAEEQGRGAALQGMTEALLALELADFLLFAVCRLDGGNLVPPLRLLALLGKGGVVHLLDDGILGQLQEPVHHLPVRRPYEGGSLTVEALHHASLLQICL